MKTIISLLCIGIFSLSGCAIKDKLFGDDSEPTLEEKCSSALYKTLHKEECATLDQIPDLEPEPAPELQPEPDNDGKGKGKKK